MTKIPSIDIPQANSLERVGDLIALIDTKIDSRDELSNQLGIDPREVLYYQVAAHILGLLEIKDGKLILTPHGKAYVKALKPSDHAGIMSEAVRSTEIFKRLLERFTEPELSKPNIVSFLKEQTPLTGTTLGRRADTVVAWLKTITKIVNRDPKRVWEWLRDYGIETRSRGFASSKHSFFKGMKSWWAGKKHPPEFSEALRQIRLKDGRVPYLKNGVHYLKGKRGADTPNWKGGITPERAKFYASKEWKSAVRAVWAGDSATCQRCKRKAAGEDKKKKQFDIHHIVGFENRELRAVVSNLVLLCEKCHYWIHGNKNIKKEFIK